MKKSDIYEIAIKILGLYMVTYFIQVLVSLMQLITQYNSGAFDAYDAQGSSEFITYIFIESVYFIGHLTLSWLFIFNTRWVVARICEPEDFQENASLFAHRKIIYELAFRITGLILIVWALPSFSVTMKSHIEWVQSHAEGTGPGNYRLWVDGLEIFLGCILLLGTKGLVDYFGRKEADKINL